MIYSAAPSRVCSTAGGGFRPPFSACRRHSDGESDGFDGVTLNGYDSANLTLSACRRHYEIIAGVCLPMHHPYLLREFEGPGGEFEVHTSGSFVNLFTYERDDVGLRSSWPFEQCFMQGGCIQLGGCRVLLEEEPSLVIRPVYRRMLLMREPSLPDSDREQFWCEQCQAGSVATAFQLAAYRYMLCVNTSLYRELSCIVYRS